MKWNDFSGLVIAYTAALSGFVGFVGGTLYAQSQVNLMGWVGATGGWIAAFVGAATIFVILRQISQNREVAHKEANDSLEVFIDQNEELMRDLNRAWKETQDLISSTNSQHWAHNFKLIKNTCARIHSPNRADRFNDLLSTMHPSDRANCKNLLQAVHWATQEQKIREFDHYSNTVSETDPPDDLYLDHLSFRLRKVRDAAIRVNSQWEDIFANRMSGRSATSKYSDSSMLDVWYLGFANIDEDNNNPY